MNNFFKINLIASLLLIQGCNVFNNDTAHELICNHPKVIETVKGLYINKVNNSPLSHKLNAPNTRLFSTRGIGLINIQQIDPTNSDNEVRQNSKFINARSICKGTIEHSMLIKKLYRFKDDSEDLNLFENNNFEIPILYAVNYEDGSDDFEVQFSIENSLNFIQAFIVFHKLDELYSQSDEQLIPLSNKN